MTRRFRRLFVALPACMLLVPAPALAAKKPRPQDRVLADFDVRAAVPSATPRPRLHRSVTGPLTEPSSAPPRVVAQRFVASNAALFGLEPDDLATLSVTREYSSLNDPLTHVSFSQSVDGIEVFQAIVGVHVDRQGRVEWVTSTAVATRNRSDEPSLDAAAAIRAAAADVRPELSIAPRALTAARGREHRGRWARGPFKRDIEARLVYFPIGDRLELAWHVSALEPGGVPQAYELLIGAADARTLFRRNRVRYADGQGRVVQSAATLARDPRLPDERPTGDPATGCPPPINYELRDITTPFRDSSGVLGATGHPAGNNAHVWRGAVGTEGAAGTPDGSGGWLFDFPFNAAGSAETFLFFASNFLHDFFYDLGFDEAAGNFQVDNFGRGGSGGDPLFALARNSTGRNNASFEPRPEGESPRMNMYLWDGSDCWASDVDGDGSLDIDGDYDLDIIIHEFHHGVTFRLNPAWSGDEAGAIGEGGSDFFAYSVNGDTVLAEYSAPPVGIRAVNFKTYEDWFCYDFFFFAFCEPHDNGEIWANVLWDLRERFRSDLVGGSEQAAVKELERLYVDGLKLSPPAPTMLDLRDSMLAADRARNPDPGIGGSANYCRLWSGFAGRGMGAAAQDTRDTGTLNVVADYTVPAGCPAPPPPPEVTIAATDASAAEAGLDPALFTITRTGDTSSSLTVWIGEGGTAISGSDYVALPPSVTIAAGAVSATIEVRPIDDSAVESNETITVTLQPAGRAYTIGSPGSATATLTSDDVAPDLIVSALTVPRNAGAGSAITITDTTKNQGTGGAAATVTRFFFSKDAAWDAADTAIGSRAVPALAPAETNAASTAATVPEGTAVGFYYIVAIADADASVSESNDLNNGRFASIQIGPDLVVSALSVPANAGAGTIISVTDTTRNQGGGQAGASLTRFHLSANTTLDGGDVVLDGSRGVPALAGSESSSGATSLTIPSSTATGTYYLFASADAGAVVQELQETNNTRFGTIKIGPDLAVTSLTGPAAAAAGAAIVLNDTTKNHGAGAAGPTTTRFFFSTNFQLDASDVALDGSRAVGALAAGASSSGSTTVTIPASAGTGSFYVIAQADGDAAEVETNEGNNTRFLSIRIGPDLTVTSVSVPSRAAAGAAISVTDTVKNNGGGASDPSTTRFYLSVNYTLDASDVVLDGSRAVPALAAGVSSSGPTTVTIPASTAAGAYLVIAKADADGAVVETSETNNTGNASVQVGPDLIVTTITVPASAAAGSVITVSETAKNQGAALAGPSTARFYLSTNVALDASDVPLDGARAVPELAPNATSLGSTSLTIPAGTAPGQYYIIVKQDADGSVAESNEANNTTFRAIQISAP